MALFLALLVVAGAAALYIYLNVKLAKLIISLEKWVRKDGASQINWFLWRIEKALLRQTSPSSSAIGAIFLILLCWLLFRLKVALDFGWIIWWWCCAALCAAAAFAVVVSGLAKTCWGAIGDARPAFPLLLTLAFSGWVWFIANEAASDLNHIFGLPGRDFPSAISALTFLYTVTLLAVVSGFLLLPLEVLVLFVAKPVSKSAKHLMLSFNLSLSFLLAVVMAAILFFIPMPLRVDIAMYFALKYDFESKVLCEFPAAEPEKGEKKTRFYKFTDDSRGRVLSLLQAVDEPRNLFDRAKAAKVALNTEEFKKGDSGGADYSRYFTDLKVQACRYSEQ